MGHHIDSEGRFRSDKYPDLPPDKIILSFKDPKARIALIVYAAATEDYELGEDIEQRILAIEPKSKVFDDARWKKENRKRLLQGGDN